MPLSIHQKQVYIYLALILATVLASFFCYRLTQKKWLHLNAAESLYEKKSFKEAIPLYEESLAEGVTSSKAVLHLADSYTAIGKFPEAIQYYRRYLDIYPNDSNARLSLARTLSWNGNYEESQKEYQKLLEGSKETR